MTIQALNALFSSMRIVVRMAVIAFGPEHSLEDRLHVTAFAVEHLMGAVDDMAIMDYRTAALGPNGALALAHDELEMAARFGVEVFVGVETTRLNDEDLHDFYGVPEERLPEHARARWIVLSGYDDGRPGRFWLVDSAQALERLSREIADAALVRHWPAGRPTRVSGALQSFHGLGVERMESVTTEIVRHLARRPTFAGLAFHDYPGLRALVESR